MDIKTKTRQAYNEGASVWHAARKATVAPGIDSKLLKQNRPHLFIEKPAMISKVPDLTNKEVLCLGCGSGEECEFLLTKHPKKLVGIDLSDNLIGIAKETIPEAEFYQMDAEELTFENDRFDFIYSSLMLDYFENWDKVLFQVNRVLKKDGIFLFSNIHPVRWAAETISDTDGKTTSALMGFERIKDNPKPLIHGNYLDVTSHNETWLKSISLTFYTKPVSLMYKELKNAGLEILDILEPKAVEKTKEYDIAYWQINQKIPSFIIFECKKIRQL